MNLHDYIARQLNDHLDSPSGVEQATYTEWHKTHIDQAIELGALYLYSIIPHLFTEVKSKTVTTADCLITFCDECSRFIDIVTITNGDNACIKPSKVDATTNDLTSLFGIGCVSGGVDNINEDSFNYSLIDELPCGVLFSEPVPKGTVIRYTCATSPDDIDTIVNGGKFAQYLPMIADFALWCLYRTDSESRSNLARAELHYRGVSDFVTNQLLLEFSLREDDYNFGRRKVDDD